MGLNCNFSLRFFSFKQVRAFLQSSMDGVVLETYGSGNAPNNCPELLDLLRKATDSNVVILNCTQCLRGSVSSVYATGKVRGILQSKSLFPT